MNARAFVKARSLAALMASGVGRRIARSAWRRERLLILCYHGISIADEHQWRPALYIAPRQLAHRLEQLRSGGYAVLSLDEGLERLYGGTLPNGSVVLTFDDGGHDFHLLAAPLLKQYGFPATVYLRTDYCGAARPVFLLMLMYLLWKAPGRTLEVELAGERIPVDTRTPAGRKGTASAIRQIVQAKRLSIEERDLVLTELAHRLRLDYNALKGRRLLQLMSPDEVEQLARRGTDFQLHTHNHHAPRVEAEFRDQIRRNREVIEQISGKRPVHFCYPSGQHAPELLPWLHAEGVVSATTCVSGLAHRTNSPLLLPRFIDTMQRSAAEFDGWAAGVGVLVSRPQHYDA